jgi:hypothetical protein
VVCLQGRYGSQEQNPFGFVPRAKSFNGSPLETPMFDQSEPQPSFEQLEKHLLSVLSEPPIVRHDAAGKTLAALLIYLAAFVFALSLFLRGSHFLAYIALLAVWAVFAAWLQEAGRR